jgi:diadenosine tetraphosphate (Ap4A) HIT family hydrolase
MGHLAHLWAGWRGEYLEGAVQRSPEGADACTFCRIFASDRPAEQTLIVARTAVCVVIMNLYPYTSGHVMVIPQRHLAMLPELSAAESEDLWATIQRTDAALRRAFAPEGINVGINQGRAAGAGIPNHLHVHLVPRWTADTNFMTAVADTRIVGESLTRSYERLLAGWQ